MSFAEPPRRMPVVLIPIIFASVIACGGYMLFSVRYGKPIRQAEEAVAGMKSLERNLPAMVANAVEESNRSATAGLEGVLGERLAETEVARDSFARRIAELEAEVARLRIMAQQGGNSRPAGAAPNPGSIAQGAPPSAGVATGSNGAPDPVEIGASPPSRQPYTLAEPLAVSQKGDLQISLLSAKTSGKQVVVEISVAKLTAGDGYFAVISSRQNKHRVVTGDGLEVDVMNIGRPGGSQSFSHAVDLISGAPMRLVLYYKGQVPDAPFLARRIELTAYEDREKDFPLQFQFDNIMIED